MNRQTGTYILKETGGESYKAYIPAPLPPDPPLNLLQLYPYLEKATRALAELNALAKVIPNISLFIYMYVRKEALLSSQIEGTQSSFTDLILFEHNKKPNISLDDVEEVSNYVKAINHGLNRLNRGFPLCLRLLREVHNILLSGSRGASKLPGEFRKSQNWIGGTRPGNALFVPPPVEDMDPCLSNLENFLHDKTYPVLIKAGLAHVQFETIHPFLDGNGRLGRLLIILLLCEFRILDEPILYLSLYLKQNREIYYELLQQVRQTGRWETWLEFFLEGVYGSAIQALHTIKEINKLFANDFTKIETLGRARFSCQAILDYMKKLPLIVPNKGLLGGSAPTARSALNRMVELGILKEVTGKKKGKIYVYQRYLNILESGTEPLKYL